MPVVTAWKLQKLIYYAQAWSFVWDERPLLVSASKLGLTARVSDLYKVHRGLFMVKSVNNGDPDAHAAKTPTPNGRKRPRHPCVGIPSWHILIYLSTYLITFCS